MASKVTVLRKYRPELKRMRTMQTPAAVEQIAQSTGLNEGEIRFVAYELRDVILSAASRAQAVKIDGLGTFTPTIRMDGRFDMLFRPDPAILRKLNNRDSFFGEIKNKASIGKSAQELFALWDQEHPDDPVE